MAGHSKHSSLQILLMASKVNKGNDFRRLLADLCPIQAASVTVRFVDYLAFLIKSQDVIAHAAGAATLHFMLVPEELLSCKATSIIQLSMSQHTQQSALTGVHIPHYSHPEENTIMTLS